MGLKEVAAGVLRAGLAAPKVRPSEAAAVVVKDKKTGLPVIECLQAATRGHELTPDRIAEILESQEAEWACNPG